AETSPVEKVDAVAAATIPRGAIHPMNARSRPVRSLRAVDSQATAGRTASTSTATSPMAGRIRPRSDWGVTVAEIEMNSSPMISCASVSKNGRRAGISIPRRLAAAMPIAAGDEERYRRFELLVNSPALFNAVVTAVELDIFA